MSTLQDGSLFRSAFVLKLSIFVFGFLFVYQVALYTTFPAAESENRTDYCFLARERLLESCKSRIHTADSYSSSRAAPDGLPLIKDTRAGRLGNFMFQVASLIGQSRSTGRTPMLLYADNRSSIFPYLQLPVFPGNLSGMPALGQENGRHTDFTQDLIGQYAGAPVIIHGYLQSWKYFDAVQDEIKAVLTFDKTVYQSAIRKILLSLKKCSSCCSQETTLVGIHIRRGDFVPKSRTGRNRDPNFWPIVAPDLYILHQMADFRKKRESVAFFVVSDDMAYCKKRLRKYDNVFFMENGTAEVDLAVMQLMDGLILSTGTFGWWAAYLGDAKEVVYYKHYPRPGSEYDKQLKKEDFFPPHWIPGE